MGRPRDDGAPQTNVHRSGPHNQVQHRGRGESRSWKVLSEELAAGIFQLFEAGIATQFQASNDGKYFEIGNRNASIQIE